MDLWPACSCSFSIWKSRHQEGWAQFACSQGLSNLPPSSPMFPSFQCTSWCGSGRHRGPRLWSCSTKLIIRSDKWESGAQFCIIYDASPLGTRNVLFLFAKSPGAEGRQVSFWLHRMRNRDVKTCNWLSEYPMRQHGGSRNLLDYDGCASLKPWVFELWVEHRPGGFEMIAPHLLLWCGFVEEHWVALTVSGGQWQHLGTFRPQWRFGPCGEEMRKKAQVCRINLGKTLPCPWSRVLG